MRYIYHDKKYLLSFESDFTLEGKKRNSRGEIELVLCPLLDRDLRFKYFRVEAEGDTTGTISFIGNSLIYVAKATTALSIPDNYKKVHITSREVENGEKIFILSYAEGINNYQYLLHVDVASKNLKYAEILYLIPPASYVIKVSYQTAKNGETTITGYEYKQNSTKHELNVKSDNIRESSYKGSMGLFYKGGDRSKPY